MTAVSSDWGEIATENGMIPDGEPVVVLRATDSLSTIGLRAVAHRAAEMGKEDLARHVGNIVTEFEAYQTENTPTAGESFPTYAEAGSAQSDAEEFHE